MPELTTPEGREELAAYTIRLIVHVEKLESAKATLLASLSKAQGGLSKLEAENKRLAAIVRSLMREAYCDVAICKQDACDSPGCHCICHA